MNTLLTLLALSCLCGFSTSFIFGPPAPPRKRDCQWAAWKRNGICKKSKYGPHRYHIELKRDEIPARHGGKSCVGSATSYETCDEVAYYAWRFFETVISQPRGGGGGSAKRVLVAKPAHAKPARAKPEVLNPCSKPDKDAKGNIRMLGKPCARRTRRRRSADGGIEVYEEPLRESIRVKRQLPTLSTKHRDILFLIDESGSVGPTNFKKEVRLAKAIVSTLCGAIAVGRLTTQVGILSFDEKQHPNLDFNQLFDRAAIISHMNNSVTYSTDNSHGSTCIVDAFEFTRTKMFTTGRGARMGGSNVEQLIVLFTDGCANCAKSHAVGDVPGLLKDMRIKFEKQKIPIVSFFIGDIDRCRTIMEGLADGAHCYQVFRALNWGELDRMSEAIENQVCMDSWQIGQSCPTE